MSLECIEQLSLVCLEGEQETISLTEMWKQYAPKDKNGYSLKQHQPNTWLGLEYTRRVISSVEKKLRTNKVNVWNLFISSVVLVLTHIL